jgi:5-methyltetrahydropteroyltriglutamate--homocysteine methyltransferase
MPGYMARIRTTHTGSLPRPQDLLRLLPQRQAEGDRSGFEARARAAVEEVVRQQAAVGLDLVNDGEQSKIGYATYVQDRLSGFEGAYERPAARRPEFDDHPDFARPQVPGIEAPACTGEVRMVGLEAVDRDVATLKAAAAAAGVAEDRLFMTAASPGVITHFFANHHYPTREAFLAALADAMRQEYRTIVESGLLLQVDCPDLAMSRHSLFSDRTLAEFRREVAMDIEALNDALRGLPAERLRLHVCWGNYEGPHTYDVALAEIIDVIVTAAPAGISLEASNPRHAHEWQVFETFRLPDDKYLLPGVVDSTCNYVEHPDLVAQRLRTYARLVGPERVVGSTDCGFGTFAGYAPVAPSVAWAKLRSLVEGARRASGEG